MGIKSLALQMIPWCFPLMGGGGVAEDGAGPARPVRLIMADGRVEFFDRPTSAAELMKEHPKHLICRSDSFTIGQMIPALPEEELLKPGQAYFLLPLHFFQSVLSFVTLASSFALLHRPFDVLKTPSGKLQIRVSVESPDGAGDPLPGRVCTTAALEKDYQQLVIGSRARQWKPKLETIRESDWVRMRRLAAVGPASALGNLRRRKQRPPSPLHKIPKRKVSIVSTFSQLLSSDASPPEAGR